MGSTVRDSADAGLALRRHQLRTLRGSCGNGPRARGSARRAGTGNRAGRRDPPGPRDGGGLEGRRGQAEARVRGRPGAGPAGRMHAAPAVGAPGQAVPRGGGGVGAGNGSRLPRRRRLGGGVRGGRRAPPHPPAPPTPRHARRRGPNGRPRGSRAAGGGPSPSPRGAARRRGGGGCRAPPAAAAGSTQVRPPRGCGRGRRTRCGSQGRGRARRVGAARVVLRGARSGASSFLEPSGPLCLFRTWPRPRELGLTERPAAVFGDRKTSGHQAAAPGAGAPRQTGPLRGNDRGARPALLLALARAPPPRTPVG